MKFGIRLGDPVIIAEKRKRWLTQMADGPANLRAALAGLSEEQISSRYREGGWTLRQVVHHLADAHLNGFARFKLALTEDNPPIKTYEETLWAETTDGRDAPVELSLKLLEALHERWVFLLDSLAEGEFARTFSHPQRGVLSIDAALQFTRGTACTTPPTSPDCASAAGVSPVPDGTDTHTAYCPICQAVSSSPDFCGAEDHLARRQMEVGGHWRNTRRSAPSPIQRRQKPRRRFQSMARGCPRGWNIEAARRENS